MAADSALRAPSETPSSSPSPSSSSSGVSRSAAAAKPRYDILLVAFSKSRASASTPLAMARLLVFGRAASHVSSGSSPSRAAFAEKAARIADAVSASSVACRVARGTLTFPRGSEGTMGRSPGGNRRKSALSSTRRSVPERRAGAAFRPAPDSPRRPSPARPNAPNTARTPPLASPASPVRTATDPCPGAFGSCRPAGPAPLGRSVSRSRTEAARTSAFASAVVATFSRISGAAAHSACVRSRSRRLSRAATTAGGS